RGLPLAVALETGIGKPHPFGRMTVSHRVLQPQRSETGPGDMPDVDVTEFHSVGAGVNHNTRNGGRLRTAFAHDIGESRTGDTAGFAGANLYKCSPRAAAHEVKLNVT